MSYQSRLDGRIEIEPALSWGEIQALGPHWLRKRGDNSLMIEVVETAEDDDQGTRIIRRGVAIVSGWDTEEVNHGPVLLELDEFTSAVRGHTYRGALVRWGVFRNDVERYRITDRGVPGQGNAVSETAAVILRWPDGSEDKAPEF